jgi:hypothetical protein
VAAARPAAVVIVAGVRVQILGSGAEGVADLLVIDTLARLRAVARDEGWPIELALPDTRLVDLLDLVGMAELFGVAGGSSALDPVGEPEGREQPQVEEVVQRRDPPA